MSGKWNDITTAETECHELLAPTVPGVVTRQHDADPDTQFSAFVEESGGARHHADRRFADLTEVKIWAENEIARIVGQQTDVS